MAEPEPLDTELNAKEQAYLNDLLKQDNPVLNKLKSQTSPNDDVVQLYLQSAIDKIQRELDDGRIKLNDQKPITKSKQRIAQLTLKKHKLAKQLGYLDLQLSTYDQPTSLPQPPVPISNQEHQKLARKMFKLHQQYEKLHSKHLQDMEKKMQEEEQLKKQEQEKKIQLEKVQKRKKIEASLMQMKEVQAKRNRDAEEAEQRIEEVKNKKFLHEKMMEKYEKEVLIPTLELKKKRLKQIREFRRPLSIEQLRQHEEQYKKRKQQLSEHANHSKFKHPKYQPPAKSARLQKLLEQQQAEKNKVVQEKKRDMQDKIARSEEYNLYLKENFRPTVDQQKRRQIEDRISRAKSHSKDDLPDPKMVGLGYLEFAKRKHKTVSRGQGTATMLESRDLSYREKSPDTANMSSQSKADSLKPRNYLTTRDSKDYYEERKKRLDRIIEDSSRNRVEKVKQLKAQAEKLTELANRKNQLLKVKPSQENEEEATELLLASIRAKMGIIDIYKS